MKNDQEERLLFLATDGAHRRHDQARAFADSIRATEGIDPLYRAPEHDCAFDQCDHRDCILVRTLALASSS